MEQHKRKVCFLQGNEAVAEGAIAAGIGFFAGYPITPATEIAEVLSRRIPQTGGKFIQMEDELACMGAVCGASLAGVKAMTATSGPGFTLVQENIDYAAISEIPVVVVDVMRGGPSTGNPTLSCQGDVMMSRWGPHGDHPVIVLAPNSVAECYTLTVEAFNYAEKYRVPVILLSDAIIGHMRERLEIPASVERFERVRAPGGKEDYRPYGLAYSQTHLVPAMDNLGDGYRHYISGCIHDETGSPKMESNDVTRRLVTRLCGKITENRDQIVRCEQKYAAPCDILVVAYGSSARPAEEAVRQANALGIRTGFFRPITLWPSPGRELAAAAEGARAVIVPEMNDGQYAGEVERIFGAAGKPIPVIKIKELGCSPFHPDRILATIKEAAE